MTTKKSPLPHLHISCLARACQQLNIPHTYVDNDKHLFCCTINSSPFYFIANHTPFNSHIIHKITQDKLHTQQLLQNVIAMPHTKQYYDTASSKITPTNDKQSIMHISNDIFNNFSFPLIIKPNHGQQGNNIFLCHSLQAVATAIQTIFNHNSPHYNHILLAQNYIQRRHEWRVIIFQQQIVLIYEKDTSSAQPANNISPLHWPNAVAKPIFNTQLQLKLQSFIEPIFTKLPIVFAGLDIIEDTNGELWLIEINSAPGFHKLVADNGQQILVDLYKQILPQLK